MASKKLALFLPCWLARRDNPDLCAQCVLTVDHQKRLRSPAESGSNESFLAHRVIRIVKDFEWKVLEYGGSFFEGDTVLFNIALIFELIPYETKLHIVHYNVHHKIATSSGAHTTLNLTPDRQPKARAR
jgi:hypothetical protein